MEGDDDDNDLSHTHTQYRCPLTTGSDSRLLGARAPSSSYNTTYTWPTGTRQL